MLKHAIDLNKYKNRDKNNAYHEEYQYLNLLQDLLTDGVIEEGRNGNTIRGVGSAMHFSLDNGKIPVLTTKKTAWKTCIKELLFFCKGQTDNKILTDNGVNIWNGNTTQEHLDSRGLSHYTPGRELGPVYGFQWRHWNANYTGCETDYTGKGIDQLQNAINMLKDPDQRTSRRIIVSAWNPAQVDDGVLPSCHNFFQFIVTDGNKLSCLLYQRSGDEFLGIPFNCVSYSVLTHMVAKICELVPHEFIHYGGDVHIYDDHKDQVTEQLKREPYEFPTLEILNNKDELDEFTIDDFKLHNYQHHPVIKGGMRA
tara:strand:+ start:2417 stop:3349 length:933 start_codon:yes stop_codon:yes gene_type:complete